MDVYVVMWENWDGCSIGGGDSYMSLDYDKAKAFMDKKAAEETDFVYRWDEKNDMWINRNEYFVDKLYIDTRTLDEEL